MNKLVFEIHDSGNYVKIEPLELTQYGSNIDWDKNWVKSKVSVKGGAFSGYYTADIMTVDFEKFKHDLSKLYYDLKGTAIFEDMEHAIRLEINGDGAGHFQVQVTANDNPGPDCIELNFTLSFDQTEIKNLVHQLDKITETFPISGDFNIKNT